MLIITIIVIIILATAVILSIANNNPIENAKEAKFKNDVKTMQEELELLKASNYANNGVNYDNKDGSKITLDNLKSADKYNEKFVVNNGELNYKTSKLTEKELTWVKEIGLKPYEYILKDGEYGVTIEEGTLSTNWNGIIPEEVGTDIIIPEGVTTIAYSAFSGCSSLTSITLPNSVSSLDSGAFDSCNSLINITIPSSLTSIETGAFQRCNLLTSIIIEGEARFSKSDIKNWLGGSDDITNINISGSGYIADSE